MNAIWPTLGHLPKTDTAVSALYRYPVKSMRGEGVPDIVVSERGVVGDREWAVTFSDGRVGSGKTWQHFRRVDGLLQYTAVTRDGRVEVHTPDGEVLTAGDGRLDAQLTALADESVSLAQESRTSHFDVSPIHLISHSSLRELAATMPADVEVAVERFRPNLVLDGGDEPWPEERWVGKTISVGDDVLLEVIQRTERCVMTTLPQGGLQAAKRVLKALATEFDTCLGVYAKVVNGGRVRRGDVVRLC